MAYIGGVTHFIGPVVGAVTLTWLQISLSGFTGAWLLYLGLFFMAIILFAPSGLAGLIVMHGAILRTRALGSVLAAYAIALAPALVMGAGAVALIEMSFRVSTQAELGTRMRVLGIPLDAATPWSWIGGAVLLVGGFAAFRATWPRVAAAWARAGDEVAASRAIAAGRSPALSAKAPASRGRRGRIRAGAPQRGKALRRDRDHSRRLARRASRRAPRDHRPERRRQVDALQPDQRPPPSHEGVDPPERRGDRGVAAVSREPARTGAELPGDEHLSAPFGLREHPLQRAVVARLQIQFLAPRGEAAGRQRADRTRRWSRSG